MLASTLRRAALAVRARRYGRRVDPQEIRWMLDLLGPGDLLVDVGAHKGGYTYLMRRAVGASGAVLACEPQPELAAYLRGCVQDFGWTNVTVLECALSSEWGRRTLWRPADSPSPAASLDGASLPPGPIGHEVEVDTLDRVLGVHAPGRPVRLVKVDVEGHELEVLAGARATLEHDRPALLVECEARHAPHRSVADVFAWLEALGYRGSFFLGGARHDVAGFDPGRHQIERRRPYVNNFVFEPAE